GERAIGLEVTVRPVPARMHDALGNPLVVEMRDLFAEDEVLEQGGTTHADLERVLIVGDDQTLIGGQRYVGTVHLLMELASRAGVGALLVVRGCHGAVLPHHGRKSSGRGGIPSCRRDLARSRQARSLQQGPVASPTVAPASAASHRLR